LRGIELRALRRRAEPSIGSLQAGSPRRVAQRQACGASGTRPLC
jgi:hypothetical protein